MVVGDIGCYTLGALPPLSAMHTCGCMGASLGVIHGVNRAGVKDRTVGVSVNLGTDSYPEEGEIERILSAAENIFWVDATAIAVKLGNPTAAGVVVLGFFSGLRPEPGDVWLSAISKLAPQKFVELNLQAFNEGRKLSLQA